MDDQSQQPRVSPRFQETVNLVMWKSNKSGATYSAIRKDEYHLNSFLRALNMMGFHDVTVTPVPKPWIPARVTKEKGGKSE